MIEVLVHKNSKVMALSALLMVRSGRGKEGSGRVKGKKRKYLTQLRHLSRATNNLHLLPPVGGAPTPPPL